MIHNRSAPPGTVVPFLVYRDVAQAIAWLTGAFGFRERLRTPPAPDGTIHHAQMVVGAGSVVLTCRPEHQKPPHAWPAFFVAVEDVDAHCERAREFGARILNPPRSSEFGERQYSVEDLEGYHWTFSESVADVNPEDWGALVQRS